LNQPATEYSLEIIPSTVVGVVGGTAGSLTTIYDLNAVHSVSGLGLHSRAYNLSSSAVRIALPGPTFNIGLATCPLIPGYLP